MAESTNIFAAAVSQWRNSTALKAIPLSSTRIAAGATVTTPYCIVACRTIRRKFCSGNYRATYYRVTFMLYSGMSKSEQATLEDAMTDLFDRNVGLPLADNCYVMEVIAEEDDPEVDPADYFGQDVNVLKQTYRVLLNETIPAVNATAAS